MEGVGEGAMALGASGGSNNPEPNSDVSRPNPPHLQERQPPARSAEDQIDPPHLPGMQPPAQTEADQIEALKQANAKLIARQKQLHEDSAAKDQLLNEQKEENAKLKMEKEKASLAFAFVTSESDIPAAVARGAPSSHMKTKHNPAEQRVVHFECIDDLEDKTREGASDASLEAETVQDKLKNRTSHFLVGIDEVTEKNPRTFTNEIEIGDLILRALQDAARIVNCSVLAGQELQLSVRRESSLFTNWVDHAVVFERVSGAPVLIVEVKKPHEKVGKSPTIIGQVYDYLRGAQALGICNPFVVLTTYTKSWVYRLDEQGSNDIANDVGQDRFQKLRPSIGSSSPKQTPSPPQLFEDRGLGKRKRKQSVIFVAEKKRICCVSQEFKVHKLVHLLTNATACGLKSIPPRRRRILSGNDRIDGNVLMLNKSSYDFGKLECAVTGSRAKRPIKRNGRHTESNKYVFDVLGMGLTSKVFHAIDDTGAECAIKMYVCRYNQETNEWLKKDVFRKQAEKAVQGEVDNYHTIYPELEDSVWKEELNGFHCVILPAFKPIPKEDRVKVASQIKDVLEKVKPLSFKESDRAWRHVGTLDGKVYLFDLADLETVDTEELWDEYVKEHVDKLMSKVPESS